MEISKEKEEEEGEKEGGKLKNDGEKFRKGEKRQRTNDRVYEKSGIKTNENDEAKPISDFPFR